MKYIDAEKLIERLEEMKQAEYENCGGVNSKTGALQEVQELINSLQQEQPEVDLEEAAAAIILKKHPIMKDAFTMEMAFYEMLELVKAGYELGLNARK